ncbi:nucleoside 2-deoxyribosyltransferase domain-containing protein [Streptomyces uncialis]|uniref:nucleoside 2-deoxyribosyltransferase domain-containing protein n=1 Tax=Streptomyces uncialis TaxID=1048205 RepID=UPI0036473E9A
MKTCAFCAIAAGDAPAVIVREWDDALAIRPRSGGVNTGHVLVLPRAHVEDAGTDPDVTAAVMRRAAELVAGHSDANIITSKGVHGTASVAHLHAHVVPRQADDGLPLPWTPQQAARSVTARNGSLSNVALVMAREPLPAPGPSVFLAGPTPRLGGPVDSWRPAAVAELTNQWRGTGTERLTILSPESSGGRRAAHYDDQVAWETEARATATAILFWIPRDLTHMPGFTTNVEFGLDAGTGRAVLGVPPDCPNPERNRYLVFVARRHGVPVHTTLSETATAALALVQASARR